MASQVFTPSQFMSDVALLFVAYAERMRISKRDFRGDYEKDLLDMNTISIFSMILAKAMTNYEAGRGFECQLSATEISRRLHGVLGRKAITNRLKLLAQYWFITVDTEKRIIKNGKPYRQTERIAVNKEFLTLLGAGKIREYKRFADESLTIGNNREAEEQGFQMTVKYGKTESEKNIITAIINGELLAEGAEEKVRVKNEKKAQEEYWKEKSAKFVACAAESWSIGQQEIHDDSIDRRPTWAGNINVLSSADRKARNDLMNVFKNIGGKAACTAWHYFSVTPPQTDEFGRTKFDRENPHKSCTFSEKNPTQFAKWINSILNDKDFKRYSTGDNYRDEIRPYLRNIYGELVDIEAKYVDTSYYTEWQVGDSEIDLILKDSNL